MARRTTIGHAGEGFPDYESILIGLPAAHHATLARDAITRALASLPPSAPHLRLDFETERLELHALDSRATVASSWSGPSLSVFVDGRFFADAVDATVGPDLVIEVSDPLQPIMLRSADTGTFSVLTMPVRPPNAG